MRMQSDEFELAPIDYSACKKEPLKSMKSLKASISPYRPRQIAIYFSYDDHDSISEEALMILVDWNIPYYFAKFVKHGYVLIDKKHYERTITKEDLEAFYDRFRDVDGGMAG